jgi:hypothetical protein
VKAAVLEIKNNKAAVLDDNGVIHVIKNKDYSVGQVLQVTELELKRDEVKSTRPVEASRFARVVAAVIAVVIVGGGITAYAAPVSTVTVDGAYPVEYRLNVFDRVVGADCPDENMRNLPREVRGMKIDDAIDVTMEKYEDELFPVGDDEMMLSVHIGGMKKGSRTLNDEMNRKVDDINKRRAPEKDMPENDSPTIDEMQHNTRTETEPGQATDEGIPGNATGGESMPPDNNADLSRPEDAGSENRKMNDGKPKGGLEPDNNDLPEIRENDTPGSTPPDGEAIPQNNASAPAGTGEQPVSPRENDMGSDDSGQMDAPPNGGFDDTGHTGDQGNRDPGDAGDHGGPDGGGDPSALGAPPD